MPQNFLISVPVLWNQRLPGRRVLPERHNHEPGTKCVSQPTSSSVSADRKTGRMAAWLHHIRHYGAGVPPVSEANAKTSAQFHQVFCDSANRRVARRSPVDGSGDGHAQSALETKKGGPRQTRGAVMTTPATPITPSERVVLTPTEFASVFGRHYTWAYRQIYAGKVKVISKLGRMMIPRSEVDRLLQEKEVYTGKK